MNPIIQTCLEIFDAVVVLTTLLAAVMAFELQKKGRRDG